MIPLNPTDKDRILRLLEALDAAQGTPVTYNQYVSQPPGPFGEQRGYMRPVSKPAATEVRISVDPDEGWVNIQITGRAPRAALRAALADPSGPAGAPTIPGVAE